MTATAADVLVAPTYHTGPSYDRTLGPEVADLATLAGFAPDPEQRLVLDDMFALRPNDTVASFEVAAIAARQNLKTGLFKQAAMGWLWLMDQRLVVWSAHEFSTAAEAFRDMVQLIDGCAALSRRVKAVRTTTGAEAIELHGGARLRFKARTSGGGRGLTGDKIVLDEAFALKPAHVGALLPTLSAVPDPQVVYGSSAGQLQSGVLRTIRERGRAGNDPRLTYVEWMTKPRCRLGDKCTHALGVDGCTLDDLVALREANPQLGRRITEDYVVAERHAIGGDPELLIEYMRERAGWWQDPPSEGGVLDIDRWLLLGDPDAERPRSGLVLGADVGEDRRACIGVAWDRPDGGLHVMNTQQGAGVLDVDLTVAQATARLKALALKFGCPVALGGPADVMRDDLDVAGVEVLDVTGSDFAEACGTIIDGVRDETIRHGNQRALDDSVRYARGRYVGTDGAIAWVLKESAGIGPLAAVTRAVAGLTVGGVMVW